MYKIFYIFLFLFFYIISFAQDSINTSASPKGINVINNKYYFTNNVVVNKRIGTIEFLKTTESSAKEKKQKDLLKLIKKTKNGMHNTVFCTVFGGIVIVMGGGICVSSLMQYPNAYKTDEEVAEIHKSGIIVGLSSLALGLTFESLAILNRHKKKKRMLELANLYNKNLN